MTDHDFFADAEYDGVFDDLNPSDFTRFTSARAEVSRRGGFDAFVEEQLRAVRTAWIASETYMQPLALVANEEVQRIFIPDDDETLRQFVERMHREAVAMGATWTFVARRAMVASFGDTDEGYSRDLDDPENWERAVAEGLVKLGVQWYAERREPDGDRQQRHGQMQDENGTLGALREGANGQRVPLFPRSSGADRSIQTESRVLGDTRLRLSYSLQHCQGPRRPPMYDDDFDDGFATGSDVDHFGAADVGAAYALMRHGQDRQADRIIAGLRNVEPEPIEVHVRLDDEDKTARPVNALDFSTVDMPKDWDQYIGQEPMKQQIAVYLASARLRNQPFPHTLLASGMPGVGKTTLARLIAKSLGVRIFELVPPFNIYTLVKAADQLDDHDVLFIDEIHKLADGGKRGAEILLKVLEEGVAFMPDGTVVELADITVIGATTDRDKLPEPVIDRFKIKPYFQPYSWSELGAIAVEFAARHDALNIVDDDLAVDMAAASRGTPRILEEMVMAAQAMADAVGRAPTAPELLGFLEVEPDGLTRTHIHYLTAMRQYFARMTKDETVEYIVGEAAIQQILRETKPGIQRVEAFLIERGLIDRTPRGRRLTDLGIQRAEEFIALGKGAADVA